VDKRVQSLKTAEECAGFIKNAVRLGHPDLAQQARQRAVQLLALAFGAQTDAEREALEAVYAYEAVLSQRNGRKTKASRTWQMIKRDGILPAVERAVNRSEEIVGYSALVEMGLEQYAFEVVVLRYQSLFSPECVARSSQRVAQWRSA